MIAAIVSGIRRYLAAQQTLTPANAKQVGNPALARVLDRWSAQASARSPPQKDRGKALIGAAAGAALGGGVGLLHGRTGETA